MRTMFKIIVSGCLLLTTAFADSWDKKTVLTVNETILVPGSTLYPGKYVLKLVDSQSNRHIIRILNERENQVITTVLAIPNYRLQPTADTRFTYWETPTGNPPALRAWFYPGDNFGQEFAYPKGLAAKIASRTAEPVPTFEREPVAEQELATVPVTTVEKPTQPVQIAQAPVAAPQAEPSEPAPAPAPLQEMPKTGSFTPALLLAGIAACSAAMALRHSIRRR